MLLGRLRSTRQVVSTEALIDGLWGEAPPSTPPTRCSRWSPGCAGACRNGTEGCSSRTPAGYRLAVARDDVDVYGSSGSPVAAGRSSGPGAWTPAAATLKAATDLWRGPAMADVADAPFAGTATGPLANCTLPPSRTGSRRPAARPA